MESALLLVQFTSKHIALFSGALFAGASTYISLVEHPTIVHGGKELIGSYLQFSKPRPAVFQTSFGLIGFVAGILAGITGAGLWWLAGSLAIGFAAFFYLRVVLPRTHRLLEAELSADPAAASGAVEKLVGLHATQSIAAMASLFIFIVNF